MQVPPGLEPGLKESKSLVMTITLWDRRNAPGGARTPDPGLIRPMLYRLSYQSDSKTSGGPPRDLDSRAKQKGRGASGFRSPYLVLAKHALFRLS